MATPLTDAINALTTYANTVTGASDTTLSDAVDTLAAGYGGGGGSSIPKLVSQATVTPETTYTSSAKGSVQLTALPNSAYAIFVYLNDYPASPDASEYIAILWMYVYSAGTYASDGRILRPAGTLGTDSSLCAYNKNTGVIQLGGSYGHFLAGTTYTILLFDLS